MKSMLAFKLCAIVISTAMLVSCGGGGGSPTDQTAADASVSSAALATFADCLKLTPGVKFVKSNGYTNLLVQEPFESQSRLGIVELRSDGTRFGARYYSIGDTYFQFAGTLRYAMNGSDITSKTIYSGNNIPLSMSVGQTVSFNYTETYTSYASSYTSTSSDSEQLTFVGFEDITLGGRTFKNSCKIKEPVVSSTTGEKFVTWIAKDFGVIRTEKQDVNGITVDGSRIELQTIITAPAS